MDVMCFRDINNQCVQDIQVNLKENILASVHQEKQERPCEDAADTSTSITIHSELSEVKGHSEGRQHHVVDGF